MERDKYEEAIRRLEDLLASACERHDLSERIEPKWTAYHKRTMDSLNLAIAALREKQQREKSDG